MLVALQSDIEKISKKVKTVIKKVSSPVKENLEITKTSLSKKFLDADSEVYNCFN